MKKIFLLDEGSRASKYGIGVYVKQLMENFYGSSEVSLNLLYLNSGKKEFSVDNYKGCTVYSFPNSKNDINNVRYYRNTWFIFLLNVEINPDDNLVFHLNYSFEYPLIGLIRESFPSCKILFTIHYQYWCFSLCGDLDLFQSIVFSNTNKTGENKRVLEEFESEKKIYNNVDKIICLSFFTKKVLKDVYQINDNKIDIVYNGSQDVYKNMSVIDRHNLKMSLQIPVCDKNVVFVGRLDEIKGVSVLIKSFKGLIEKFPNCHLYIVGEGDFSRYLKLCNPFWNKVTFTGFLEKEDLYRIYSIADVGVMLSKHEQCSYVAIEMMMFGLPVVCTNTTGLDEMFPNSKLKLSITYEDGKALISTKECEEKLLLALTSHTNNRELYLRRYTSERMRKNMLSIYRSL